MRQKKRWGRWPFYWLLIFSSQIAIGLLCQKYLRSQESLISMYIRSFTMASGYTALVLSNAKPKR